MKEEETFHYSNKEYKRLGDRIRKDPEHISDEDLRVLQHLRMTYKEPLSVIFTAIEKAAHKVDPNCICTYRVKRIESIVSKLSFDLAHVVPYITMKRMQERFRNSEQ